MSRFRHLEFGPQSEGESRRQEPLDPEAAQLAEAQSALEQGEFALALRAYSKVLEFNAQNVAAWTGQVRMLVELGEFQEAKLWADKALERFPDASELLAAKAVALARLGDLPAALAFSDASMAGQGETPYLWLARGDVMLARQEKRADYCFEKALALAPRQWLWHWLAARIYCWYKRFARAIKLVQQTLTLDAGQAAVWVQLGECQLALGMGAAARNSFEQAQQLNPQSAAAERALRDFEPPGLWSRLAGWWQQRQAR